MSDCMPQHASHYPGCPERRLGFASGLPHLCEWVNLGLGSDQSLFAARHTAGRLYQADRVYQLASSLGPRIANPAVRGCPQESLHETMILNPTDQRDQPALSLWY